MAEENVAIIIAVSSYDAPNPQLPACKNDGAIIRAILDKSGKFSPDQTLYLDADTTAASIKGQLSRFLSQLKHRKIGEVFFYFTGHGLFDGTQFRYLLSDYSPSRPETTTLSNEELDNMLRALDAGLAIKVVDACHSGQQYVKSVEEFEKALNETRRAYKYCYFMFSSEQTQPSWQDNNLSYFTLEFAKAVQQHPSSTIRYKDIIDSVSDAFASNARQKPVFVTQANFTEEFCSVDDALRLAIAGFMPSTTGTSPTPTTSPPQRSIADELKQRVAEEATQYCTEEEAMDTFAVIQTVITSYQLPDSLKEFYTLKPTFSGETHGLPSPGPIATWLEQNPGEFFAKVVYATQVYEVQESPFILNNPYASGISTVSGSVSGSIFPGSVAQYRPMVKREVRVATGFESTVSLPFNVVYVIAEPKLGNLPWWKWYVAFVVSKTEIREFATYMRLTEISWTERKDDTKVQWRTAKFPMKDRSLVKAYIGKMLNEFAEPMTSYLLEKYGLTEEPTKEPAPAEDTEAKKE